jgi:hypothetical protein
MHEDKKTTPIMYVCQSILDSNIARIIIVKTFNSIFEILNCSFHDTFFKRCMKYVFKTKMRTCIRIP